MEVENRDDGRSEREKCSQDAESRSAGGSAESGGNDSGNPSENQRYEKKDMPKRQQGGRDFFSDTRCFYRAGGDPCRPAADGGKQTDCGSGRFSRMCRYSRYRQEISPQYSPVSGRIVSSEDAVNVIPMVSGEVPEVFVEEGDYVTAGQTLFTIDSDQAQTQIDQAQLQVDQAQIQVQQAQTQVQQAQTQVRQAQLAIQSAQDSVDTMKKTLDRCSRCTMQEPSRCRIGIGTGAV